MGDGQVLETGTHEDLLQREGHYHRLVQTQKLRESVSTTFSLESEPSDAKHEVSMQEDIPLARRNTGWSLASEILEQKRGQSQPSKSKDVGLFVLARRLMPFIRDKQLSYLFGTLFAFCW